MHRNKNSHATDRERIRRFDIAESRSLLLELGLYEPNINQCINTISNACLSEDIVVAVDGLPVRDEFKRYFNYHYQQFCHDAIRCMFIYGFVPWHPRKLPSGDVIPTVLAHGTFTWDVKLFDDDDVTGHQKPWDRDDGHRRKRRRAAEAQAGSGAGGKAGGLSNRDGPNSDDPNRGDAHKRSEMQPHAPQERTSRRWAHLPIPLTSNGSKEVQHIVRLTHSGLDPEDVFVFDTTMPVFNITQNSNMYATVPSPLSHLLVDYKNLRDAQIRKSHADAWNTTARIFTSCVPPPAQNSEPTNSYLYYETGSDRSRLTAGRHYMDARHRELANQITQPSNHVPSLYNLPVYHKLEQLPSLQPCEDIEFLLEKYRREVCALTGVPFDLVHGKAAAGNETTGRTQITGRVFSKTVQRMCVVLEELVCEVYCTIYGTPKTSVHVSFNPMPRLDIASMEDLKILWEMGAITPDVVAQLSEILLISDHTNLTGRPRKTAHPPHEYTRNLETINKAMKPAPPSQGKPAGKKKKKKSSSS